MNYLQSSKIIFVPLPEEEFGHLTKQRDKFTGNTKSGKKKLKNAQEKYLSSRFAIRRRGVLASSTDRDSVDFDMIFDIH